MFRPTCSFVCKHFNLRTWLCYNMRIEKCSISKSKEFKSFAEAEAYLKLKIGNDNRKKLQIKSEMKISDKISTNKASRQKKNVNLNCDLKTLVVKSSAGISDMNRFESSRESIVNGEFNKCLSSTPLIYDVEDRAIVYTDGSCKTHKGQRISGLGVFWSDDCPLNISEKYDGVQTNNRAEIAAVTEAVRVANQNGIKKLLVRTDSMFVINCMTKWIAKWKANNWVLINKKHVECREELEKLDGLINETNVDIKWQHVASHGVDHSNNKADLLANKGADKWMECN